MLLRHAKVFLLLCALVAVCPQDFFGLMEEMRVWRVVRTQEEIREGMIADDGRGGGADFTHPGIDKDHKGESGGLFFGGGGIKPTLVLKLVLC